MTTCSPTRPVLSAALVALSLTGWIVQARAAVQGATVPFSLTEVSEGVIPPTPAGPKVRVEIPAFPASWGDLREVHLTIQGSVFVAGTTPFDLSGPVDYEVDVRVDVATEVGGFFTTFSPLQFLFSDTGTGNGEPYDLTTFFTLTATFDMRTDDAGGIADLIATGSPEFKGPTTINGTTSGFVISDDPSPTLLAVWEQAVLQSPGSGETPTVTTTGFLTVEYEFRPNFGTAAEFESGGGLIFSRLPITLLNGSPNSEQTRDDANAERTARAKLAPGLAAASEAAPSFELGVRARDLASDSFSPESYAQVATRYTVEGLAAGDRVPASFTIVGFFNALGGAVGTDTTFDVQFNAGVAQGTGPMQRLGDLQISSDADGVFYRYEQKCEIGGSCERSPVQRGWPAAVTVNVLIPDDSEAILAADLWALADAFNALEATADFLATVRLQVFPPPRVVVTLASGQVFDGNDSDEDGVQNFEDNCVDAANGPSSGSNDQLDTDEDGVGDACECGDADKDGRVNTTDARLIQRCTVGQLDDPAICEGLCDASSDGVCNTTDARLIQRVAVGQLTKRDLHCAERP